MGELQFPNIVIWHIAWHVGAGKIKSCSETMDGARGNQGPSTSYIIISNPEKNSRIVIQYENI